MNYYIRSRNNQLSSDEILQVIDTSKNPQINHIVYERDVWKVWDVNGNYHEFYKRNW